MEQENKVESLKASTDEIGTNVKQGEHREHSHHSHSSHSHSHSHSSHKKHRTSRDKKKKASVIKRIQKWMDHKVTKKGVVLMILLFLLIVSALLGVSYLLGFDKTPDSDSENSSLVESGNFANQTNTTFSEQSVTVPSYWEDMIEEKTKTVKALQTAGGKDSVSFVWASDTHIPDNHTGRTDDLGKIMAKMLDNCGMPFALLTGDIGTRTSFDTESELTDSQKMIPQHLAPLWGTDRLLVELGNHDGTWGDSAGYYRHQQSPEKLWQFYFREQALDFRRVFSEDGTYFYVDNLVQKTRFIVLNSQYGGKYAVDGNGWSVNDRFSTSCYGQEQLNWLANVALDLPKGYSAIVSAHVPPNIEYTVDKAQLIGIINAYCKKTKYNGNYVGVDGWTSSHVSVDFTGAKGEVIAMLAGHVHGDSIDTTTMACPIITIMAAGAEPNEPYVEFAPTREFGTDTETSFDVVTINKKTRTIYCTRVGAGSDRSVSY